MFKTTENMINFYLDFYNKEKNLEAINVTNIIAIAYKKVNNLKITSEFLNLSDLEQEIAELSVYIDEFEKSDFIDISLFLNKYKKYLEELKIKFDNNVLQFKLLTSEELDTLLSFTNSINEKQIFLETINKEITKMEKENYPVEVINRRKAYRDIYLLKFFEG